MSVLATRYAEALFSLALDKGLIESYKLQIDSICNIFDDCNITSFFASSRISKEEKKKVITDSLKDSVDKYVLNFLYVLVDKGRIQNYQEIFEEFHHMCCEELNIKEGILETVRPLDKKLVKDLENTLSSKDRKVELKQKTNSSLISGFKVTFDDKVIDNSMKQKIEKMEEMLKRKDGSLWN